MDEDEEVDIDGLKVRHHRSPGHQRPFSCDSIMGTGRKLGLLVWKNLLLRRRHYIVTALEILLPTLFSLVLVYGRAQANKASHGILSNPAVADLFHYKSPPDIYGEIREDVCGGVKKTVKINKFIKL